MTIIKFIQMMTLDSPWPIYCKVKVIHLGFHMVKKGKTVDFSDSIVACDIEVD